MKVKWLGHSCFLITAENGVTVLTDPFDSSVGYKVPEVAADIVSTSHGHFDHSYIQAVQGEYVHINKTGVCTHKGIEITGVDTFHDENQGAERGKNTMYKFVIDGLHICHCGDLGHVLTREQMNAIGSVDILLIPIGGFYTIDAERAAAVVNQLQPLVTMPMHFKTEDINFPIAGVDRFLEVMGNGKRLGKQEVEFEKSSMSSEAGVIVLDYK
ncbi:MAG: putative Zn-dependent hydrolase of the beta-lactamase fold [Firmicutes bacterium]|nr:putative Zn-dependent hydrolase of the beta-lactamase fold [Bacillota bacterium]